MFGNENILHNSWEKAIVNKYIPTVVVVNDAMEIQYVSKPVNEYFLKEFIQEKSAKLKDFFSENTAKNLREQIELFETEKETDKIAWLHENINGNPELASIVELTSIENKSVSGKYYALQFKAAPQAEKSIYQSVFKNANDGIILYNLKLNQIVDVNDKYVEMSGYSRIEILKLSLFDFFPEYQANGKKSEEELRILNKRLEIDKKSRKEWVQKRKDNSTYITEVTTVRLKEPFEEYSLNIIRDITERKNNEEKIRRRESQLRDIFENTNVGLGLLQADEKNKLKFLDCNQSLLTMFRCKSKNEYLNRLLLSQIPEEQIQGVISKEEIKEKLAEGINITQSTFLKNWKILRFDNTTMYVDVVIYPIESERTGNAFMVEYQEVTELNETIGALTQSESKFRNMFEYSPFGVLFLKLNEDKTRTLLDCNQALTEMFRCTKEQFLNHKESEIYPKFQDDGSNSIKSFASFVNDLYTNTITEKYWQHKRYDGSKMYNKVTVFPLSDSKDNQYYILNFQDITEKYAAEKRLANQNLELRSIIDSMPQFFFFKDSENRIRRVNKNAAISIGKLTNEIEGKLTEELYPKEDAIKYWKDDLEVINSGKSKLGIVEKYKSTEGERIVSTDKIPFVNSEGKADGVLVFASDITEKYQIQIALEDSEKQFRSLFENSGFGIYLLRVNDKFEFEGLDCNDALLNMFGCTKQEFINRPIEEMFPEFQSDGTNSLEGYRKLLKNLYTNKTKSTFREHIRFDGSIMHNIVSVFPLKTKGEYKYYAVNFQDITNEYQIRLALEESEKLYKSLFANSLIGLFLLNKKLNVIDLNKALVNMLGYDYDEIIGKNGAEIIKLVCLEEDVEDSLELMNKLNKGALKSFTVNRTCIKKDGTIIRVILFVRGNYNDANQLENVLLAILDITKLYETEKELSSTINELKEKNQELEKYISSNLELENFAYIASHDLKEPVRSIVGFAQLLRRRYNSLLDENGKDYLEFVISSASKMNLLIEDLLTFSRVHSQKDVKREEISVKELVVGVVKNLHEQIKQTKAELTTYNLPDKLFANQTKMNQVFQNLISNALKFVPKEKVPRILISAVELQNSWRFSISDNGIGISEEYRERIFILFKRLNDKTEFEGTGLGLAICKKIVEQHGGEIWVESQPNKGSIFYFTIAKLNYMN